MIESALAPAPVRPDAGLSFLEAQRTLAQPEQLLRHIKSTSMAGIYMLFDFHPYLENPLFVRTLKDIAQEYDKCARTIVLISFEVKLPAELGANVRVSHLRVDESHGDATTVWLLPLALVRSRTSPVAVRTSPSVPDSILAWRTAGFASSLPRSERAAPWGMTTSSFPLYRNWSSAPRNRA